MSPDPDGVPRQTLTQPADESLSFAWRGGRVSFDGRRCVVASLVDGEGREWVPQDAAIGLGEFVHTRYGEPIPGEVFPEVLPHAAAAPVVHDIHCKRGPEGVSVETTGERWGFRWSTHWFFHAGRPWIDVAYDLERGWSEPQQSVQFCFPLAISNPSYRYDMAGAIVIAGAIADGGNDLPGANPSLCAAQTFAAVHGDEIGAYLLTPDALLVQFGEAAVVREGVPAAPMTTNITSMPMMNLTRNDWQFNQGGQRRWRFRYRLVLSGAYDPLQPIREAQQFGVPPYLQVPGGKPTVASLGTLDVDFGGGPVTTLKVAEDGARLILRLWNTLDRPISGSVKLPDGFVAAEVCDALERSQHKLAIRERRANFTAASQSIVTLGLIRAER